MLQEQLKIIKRELGIEVGGLALTMNTLSSLLFRKKIKMLWLKNSGRELRYVIAS